MQRKKAESEIVSRENIVLRSADSSAHQVHFALEHDLDFVILVSVLERVLCLGKESP